MTENLFSLLPENKKVLIAPLDWGLGHATRCIPIINLLLEKQNEVVLAADGSAFDLLQKEFPQLKIIRLKGYNIQYSKTSGMLWRVMLKQIPKLFFTIYNEHQELKKLQSTEKIDWIISDNRYGLWNKKLNSIFITHQLKLKLPNSIAWMEWLPKLIFKFFINRYNACWVPDYEGEENLSGELSHFKNKATNTIFISPLSRMKKDLVIDESKKYDIGIVLSGPEPQRTILETKILSQLNDEFFSSKKIILVRGITNEKAILANDLANIEVKNYATSTEVNAIYLQAEKLICRSGYSTIMDLEALGKTAFYIPTPGQTEQEYLASYLTEKEKGIFIKQDELDLKAIFNSKTGLS